MEESHPNSNQTLDLNPSQSVSESTQKEVEESILIVGSENPKIVEFEELQQELARLCSLSSALSTAKEKKESLAKKLGDVIKVRAEYLLQSNELDNMREKLEAKKLVLGDVSMFTKKTLEDCRNKREQLCTEIRILLAAGKTLSAAHKQLEEANKLLVGERGHGNLKNMQKMLRKRQQYMITQVSTLYPVKAVNESKEKSGSYHVDQNSGDSTSSSIPNASKTHQNSDLTILGLQLSALPLQKMSIFSNKAEIQRSAAALGYIAHAVLLIASYLDVILRYPIRLGGSRSYVIDHAPSTESDFVANSATTEFPLFVEGQDATRAAYAIFLLNKDLEQLLNFIGAESLGPRHVLANLKELTRIICSRQFTDDKC